MAKFTEGPWEVVQSPTAGRFNLFGGCHVGSFVAGSKERLVEAQANARLIAAAPELFEALQGIIGLLNSGEGVSFILIERAEKALAKATGES